MRQKIEKTDFARKQVYEAFGKKKGLTYEEFLPEADAMLDNFQKQSEECEKFLEEYRQKHKLCPKCGGTGHSVTLAGYILDIDRKEDYKDLNNCFCGACGNSHTVHDRISEEEFNQRNAV